MTRLAESTCCQHKRATWEEDNRTRMRKLRHKITTAQYLQYQKKKNDIDACRLPGATAGVAQESSAPPAGGNFPRVGCQVAAACSSPRPRSPSSCWMPAIGCGAAAAQGRRVRVVVAAVVVAAATGAVAGIVRSVVVGGLVVLGIAHTHCAVVQRVDGAAARAENASEEIGPRCGAVVVVARDADSIVATAHGRRSPAES